eukprot:TRINITY_DN5056_c0_g2_i2.p1 TRINITY_DN5056_c0_g2~~TRINITY_DN5056_c0_g2_i2.p1  ORF type:complete len:1064 (+),score=402.94 TRINITY_DN5056_c0_g2_i2:21-3212(+)
MSSLPSFADAEALLARTQQPNTEEVTKAVSELNKVLKQSASMMILLQLLVQSQHPEIRQLAGVLLRKKVIGHWSRLPKEQREEFQRLLLESILKDPNPNVRRSVAGVVGVIARITVPTNEWPQLLQFLFQCTQSQDPIHREVSMGLFNTLTENIGETLRQHFSSLQQIFVKGLQDSEAKVRVASLKSIGSLIRWLSTPQEVEQFKQLIPLIIQVTQYCLSQGMEDEAMSTFEIFEDFVECPMKETMSCYVDIITFSLQVAADSKNDENIRKQAITVIEWILRFKPKAIYKNNLIPAVIRVLFQLSAEPEETDDEEYLEETIHTYGTQMLDVIALNVPPSQIFKPMKEYIQAMAQSQNHHERRAAIIALGIISEGCSDPMIEILDEALVLLYNAFKDPEILVREAACIALGQFSRWLQPDIIEHYKNILPMIFQSLSDPTEKVRTASCYALEAFCEHLGDEILPYLESLLTKLIEILNSGNNELKELAISAISSTSAAAGAALVPYFPKLMEFMKALLTIQDDENLPLRCRATECIGLMAQAVGKDVFQVEIEPTMKAAIQGLAMDYVELREYTYGFFSHMATVMKEEFAKFLPIVVPFIVASIESTDGIISTENPTENDVEGLSDDEDDEEGDVSRHVRTAFLDEKSSACYCIGVLAEHAGPQFLPYMDRIMKSFHNLTHYFHEDVRSAIATALGKMAIAVHKAYPSAPWIRGIPNPLQEPVKQFLGVVFPIWINMIEKDDDKETVMNALDAIGEVAKAIGPAAFADHLSGVVATWVDVFEKKTVCQNLYEDEEHDEESQHTLEDEDELEAEIRVIEALSDCIIECSKALGPIFLEYFDRICTELAIYLRKKVNPRYKALCMGVLAEICNSVGSSVAPYLDQLLPFVWAGVVDQDPETRNNATFFMGIMMEHGGHMSVPHFPKALGHLANLLNDTSDVKNIRDNACGAVARMMMNNSEAMPMDQVLPVFLRELPLKIDFVENVTICKAIFFLFEKRQDLMASQVGQVVRIFSELLETPTLDAALKLEVVAFLKHLSSQMGASFQQVYQTLTPAQQASLQKNLQ